VQASYWDEAVARSHGEEAAGPALKGWEGGREGGEDQGKWQTDGGGRCQLACRLGWMVHSVSC